MKKDNCRDYATSAFRIWASTLCLTREQYEHKIKNDIERTNKGMSPDDVLILVEDMILRNHALLSDIEACCETFRILDSYGKGYICEAVREVYMYGSKDPLRKGDISRRVTRCAIVHNVSEKQVYEWLRQARTMFSGLRGLRIG